MKNSSIRVCPLASGSRGNSLFVACSKNLFLIDAGLSGIEIQRRLTAIGVQAENLTGIIITHEHSDHVRGAGILNRRFNIPLYISQKTLGACTNLGMLEEIHFFECGTPFDINGVRISPFSISHDAQDPAGLTLEFENKKIGIATDLGIATNLVKEYLKNSHILYIESNHDPDMLMNGPYPWYLKQRVKGRRGHLSNQDTKALVDELKTERLQHIILAHLSEENNCPQTALREMSKSLNGSHIALHIAGPDQPGTIIEI